MNKIGRKIYHMAGGFILVGLYLWLGRSVGLMVLAGICVIATAVDLARLNSPSMNSFMYAHFSKFIRESEKGKLTGTPWYVLGVLLAMVLYGVPIGVYAVAFLACGDVAATTVGEAWGKTKIWGGKSLEGTAAFVAAAVAVGLLIDVSFYPLSPAVFVVGAAVAAVVEVLPIGVNDNLSIPLVSGGVMYLLARAGM